MADLSSRLIYRFQNAIHVAKISSKINSQSLEDTQVGYISQKYTLEKYTLGEYTLRQYTLGKYTLGKYTYENAL